MTEDELKTNLARIDSEYRKNVLAIKKQYALSNNTIKIGDVVSDGDDTITVESISAVMSDKPSCAYFGIKITKSGKPFKSGEKATIHQSRVKYDYLKGDL